MDFDPYVIIIIIGLYLCEDLLKDDVLGLC